MRGVFSMGRRLIGSMFLASFLVLLVSSQVWAQTAAVQNGLGWLAGNQNSDGSWPSAEVSDLHATTEALNTLTLLSPASSSLATGRAWLATQDTSPTDFLARRIMAEAGAGLNVSAQVNELLALRAPSGGWGGHADFADNLLDTALALRALKAANHVDQTVVNPALAFLTTSQNADGGWGLTKGDNSSVFLTAMVSASLQQFPQMTTIAMAVNKATAYLLARQYGDGCFGNSTSTVYETALAYAALAAVSANESALGNAVGYLASTQSANGSWNDDAYSTALALKALYLAENRPSPPPPPPAGGTITGMVMDATTNLRLSGVAVVLGSDALINTTTDSAGNFTLRDVPPGSQQVSLSLAGYQSVTVPASITVDTTVSLGTTKLVSSYSTGTIAGTITDATGRPLTGVAVTVTGAWSGTATTGVDGGYLFTFVVPGEVTITAAKTGFESVSATGTVYARTTLTFSPQLSTTPSQATTGTLVGRVVESSWGLPIDHLPGEKGVTVTLSGGISVEPDPDNRGIFRIEGLAPGTYQAVVGMNGFTSQTFRVVIAAGVTTDLGTIRLALTISKMTLIGTITDAATGAPISGAEVTVAGTLLTGRSGADGGYAIANIDHPAEITVRASAAGYSGRTFLVRTQPWVQTMNIAVTPRVAGGPPTGTEVAVMVSTDKVTYSKSDPVGLTVNLWNAVGWDHVATELIRVTDPAGSVTFEATQPLNLAAGATLIQNLGFALPLSAPGGTYTATVELRNADGLRLGMGSKSFGVTTSRITVTPQLPAVLSAGANAIGFQLTNAGTVAVPNGQFVVTLTDPDGVVLLTQSQAFALELGASTTLEFDATLPALKFGSYVLSYVQSDATIASAPTELVLPNNLTIKALFDDNSRRIRSTAGLTVSLVNAGRFVLAPGGEALSVTVAVPDAQYQETKTLVPAPAVGNTAGSALFYQFALPETLTAGLHPATITVALPSGSQQVETAQLAILESSLALAPLQGNATAGGTIYPQIVNSGGVDTPAQYTLRLLDSKAVEIAQISGIEIVRTGESIAVALEIPGGAVNGNYQMVASILDQKTGKVQVVQNPITIDGVKGELQVQTDKDEYLATESITALSSITNRSIALQGGSLHLEVVTTEETWTKKIWTSQADFQQGDRSNVDTYELPDAVTLLHVGDNFNDGVVNFDRWTWSRSSEVSNYLPIEQNGTVLLTLPNNPPRNWIVSDLKSKFNVSGDFEATVDYNVVSPWMSSGNNHAAGMQVNVPTSTSTWYARLDVWGSSPTYGAIDQPNGSYTNVGGAKLNGKLRMKRVGSSYYAYYWNGTAWTQMWSWGGRPNGPANVWLRCYGQGGNVQTQFDNFQVLTHSYALSGTLNFKYDSGRSDEWGALDFKGDIPSGTAIKFRTRSAETEAGLSDSTWSQYIVSSGAPITSPNGRWIEVEATLSTTNRLVSPTLHELGITQAHEASDILWQADVPVDLANEAIGEVNNTIGTLGVTGKLSLQGELTSSTGQTVATAKSTFYIEQGAMTVLLATDKEIYRPGEPVVVSGEVRNRSTMDAAGLTMTVANPEVTGENLYTETFDIPVQDSHPFNFTTTAGSNGLQALTGTVTQNGTVLEKATIHYEVASPALTATLAMPESAGTTPFMVTVTLTNSGKVDGGATVRVSRDQGVLVGTGEVTVPAGETRLIQYPCQIVGDTTVTVEISGDLEQTLSQTVTYAAPAIDNTVTANIVTDKIAYNPNDSVKLTATVVAAASRENLSALVTITNSQGQTLFSANNPITSLVQGQALTLGNNWNVGTNSAGTYLVSLYVLNAAGTVETNATCILTIDSVIQPANLLKGIISLDKQNLLSGDPVTVSFSVSNVGNVDLTDVVITVQMVTLDDQVLSQTITDQTALPMGTTSTRSSTINTIGLSARDYLVVLRASLQGTEETLAGTYFRVAGAPSAPALVEPANGSDIMVFNPELVISNAADPNDDYLTYEYEVYTDSSLTMFMNGGTVQETSGTTKWTIPWPLTENETYYWRVRAYDGLLYGPWMAPASFRVNTIEDPPSAPNVSSPADGTDVHELMPVLTVTNASDPDSTSLTYNFILALDPDFSQPVVHAIGVAAGQETTSWTSPVSLQENTWYYWRAQADDWHMEGPWSETASFLVNTANDPPSAPVIVTPVNDSTVAALSFDVVVENSQDPDSPSLSYYFEADVSATFDSTHLLRSDIVVEGQSATLWALNELKDNTWYHVRAKASDGLAESPWSNVVGFFVNTENDRPTAPALENPSDGTGVNLFVPSLSVHNSLDLDGDTLSYEFEVFADSSLSNPIAWSGLIAEQPSTTVWVVPSDLTENQIYFWRARSFDGALSSEWMPTASFLVNTANDAPGAPALVAPEDGRTLGTLLPALTVGNAYDPDSDQLTYEFEIYSNAQLTNLFSDVPEGINGETSVTLTGSLSDNTTYSWRARANDGERYGQWMNMATFTTHVPKATINAEIKFEPQTLSQKSKGNWVKVDIELPEGYNATDVDVSSIRLEGLVPAEAWPYEIQRLENRDVITVKFKRGDVIAILPQGQEVLVHVSGKIRSTLFEGMDIIRVIH